MPPTSPNSPPTTPDARNAGFWTENRYDPVPYKMLAMPDSTAETIAPIRAGASTIGFAAIIPTLLVKASMAPLVSGPPTVGLIGACSPSLLGNLVPQFGQNSATS